MVDYNIITQNPKFVVYILKPLGTFENFLSLVNTFNDKGINVIILSFIFFDNINLNPNLDQAISDWATKFTQNQRLQIKNAFNGVILLSHGGAAGSSAILKYSNYGYDKVSDATWEFVKNNDLDGIDIDYENIDPKALLDFSVNLANKKDKYIFTMAPQASWSTLQDHLTVYNKIGDKINWFNLQTYNQTAEFSNYNYLMIDNTDSPQPTSLRGIITGIHLPDNLYCRQGCTQYTKIPPYKIVLGSCIKSECQQYGNTPNLNPDVVASFIKTAKNDTNGYFTEWFKGGGMMVWEYLTDQIDSDENENILSNISDVKKLFNSSGNIPIIPPQPTDICKNVNCNDPYGECINGICNCYYGYSGTNCELLPMCNDIKFRENQGGNSNLYLLILGIIFVTVSLIFIYLTTKIQILKNQIILGYLLLILGITCIIIYVYEYNNSIKIDKCDNINCGDNGKCVDGKCVCNQGYTGDNCQSKSTTNKCDNINCGDNGNCVEGKCVCNKGYMGDNCQSKSTTNKCDNINCNYNGNCVDGKCVCNQGFIGNNCELPIQLPCNNTCNSNQLCLTKNGFKASSGGAITEQKCINCRTK